MYEVFTSGGDYCQQYLPNFERKKGEQHNFETIIAIFSQLTMIPEQEWQSYWAKTFLFDALIGNTDRHQDNWGIITKIEITANEEKPEIKGMRIAPVFDNGTSMGHEIFAQNFHAYEENRNKKLYNYISKGAHHIKWTLKDEDSMKHAEILKKLVDRYPETLPIMQKCLAQVNHKVFKKILDELTVFSSPVTLTNERARFMLHLLQARHEYLMIELEK